MNYFEKIVLLIITFGVSQFVNVFTYYKYDALMLPASLIIYFWIILNPFNIKEQFEMRSNATYLESHKEESN